MGDECGGYGVVLEGMTRKTCKNCSVFCNCSRECQKMHWNRQEGGHRDDCKRMVALKGIMKRKGNANGYGV